MSRPLTRRPSLPLLTLCAALSALGCMCGGAPETYTPEPVAVDAAFDAQEGFPAVPDAPASPPSTVAAAPTPTGGGWAPTIDGICQMEADCGCLEKESVAACAASLQKSAVVFSDDVNTCIVTQSCPAMCGGGAVRCVEEGTSRKMAAEQARHEAVMGVMQNFPNGGPCANGQTQVVDSRGGFVRCQ